MTWRWLAVLAALAPPGVAAAASAEDGWQLVWADEFDRPAIDRKHWTFDVDCWGGGNDERQCYTDRSRNAAIEAGSLVITTRAEPATGPALPRALRVGAAVPDAEVRRDFTSARLTTHGKAAWRYGKVEVRAMLPQGQGLWPAIWLLPESNSYGRWPASGEIDILEAVNLGVPCAQCPTGREDTILGTIHFGKPPPGNRHAGTEFHYPAVLGGFHTFAVEWQADRITWLVDGQPYGERRVAEWQGDAARPGGAPFDRPFHLILNLAFGGGLAEGRGLRGVDPGVLPARMVIDWVRVWQKADLADNSRTRHSGGDR
ncbi:MAG: glycoside hydrolase family 16 protein [Proteobacteria bacterium]|nr:glycoside hydrolase family 16 protein [Pseudomonadota bacterium]